MIVLLLFVLWECCALEVGGGRKCVSDTYLKVLDFDRIKFQKEVPKVSPIQAQMIVVKKLETAKR